jgi:outer membrane protein OmpA-like peptidoglycan-associated protein
MFRSRISAPSLVSRSNSRRAVAAGLLALVLGALALLGIPTAAAGDPMPPSGGAPIRDIIAPVRDIVVPTADLEGAARVDESEKQIKVRLSAEVLFPKDSARLRPGVRGRLSEIVQTLDRRGPGQVTIIGYTDDLGTAHHGLVLSRQRAAAVARVLRPQLDKADYPFKVYGRGEADPAVPNTSEKNRKLNRRVELTYRPSR